MPENPPSTNNSAREERLAAALRENLRRRKAQARELGAADTLPKPDQTS